MDALVEKLEPFKNHEDPFIKDLASQLLTLNDGLDRGDLTKEQFKEIAEDLMELQKIQDMADTLDRKNMLLQTVNAIRYVVEGVLL